MPLHQGSKRKQTQYQADKILNKNGKEGKAGGKQGNLKSFPYHQKTIIENNENQKLFHSVLFDLDQSAGATFINNIVMKR